MTKDEFARRVQALADEEAVATSRWAIRVGKLERSLARARGKLEQARALHKARLDELWRAYTGGEAEAPTEDVRAGTPGAVARQRARRGSLDDPVWTLICEEFPEAEEFTVPELIAAWNVKHPLEAISASTLRGVLGRHVAAGRLVEIEKGGRGVGNLASFIAVPDDESDASSGGGAAIAH